MDSFDGQLAPTVDEAAADGTADMGNVTAPTEDTAETVTGILGPDASTPYALSFAAPPAKLAYAGADTSSRPDNFFRGAKWCVSDEMRYMGHRSLKSRLPCLPFPHP